MMTLPWLQCCTYMYDIPQAPTDLRIQSEHRLSRLKLGYPCQRRNPYRLIFYCIKHLRIDGDLVVNSFSKLR